MLGARGPRLLLRERHGSRGRVLPGRAGARAQLSLGRGVGAARRRGRSGRAARSRLGPRPPRRDARVHRRRPRRGEGEARRRGAWRSDTRAAAKGSVRASWSSTTPTATCSRCSSTRSTRDRASRRGDRRRHDEVRPARAGDRQGAVVAGRERGACSRASSRSPTSTSSAADRRPTRSTACTARATTWPTGAARCGKPYIRTYVGGGTGVFAPIQGWYTVASGMADVALVVCEEKMSSLPAAPAGRVPHDLRQHHRTPARPEPAVDLRARDEPRTCRSTAWTSATSRRSPSRTSGTRPTTRRRCSASPTSRSRTCWRARSWRGRCSGSTSRRSATAPSRSSWRARTPRAA